MDFREQVNNILADYADEVEKVSEECVKRIAQAGAKELKKVSPRKTGKYASGWTYKIERGRMAVSAVIYNRAKPGLAHLLEHGHVSRNGTGRVFRPTPAHPHIQAVNDWVVDEAVDRMVSKLERGVV